MPIRLEDLIKQLKNNDYNLTEINLDFSNWRSYHLHDLLVALRQNTRLRKLTIDFGTYTQFDASYKLWQIAQFVGDKNYNKQNIDNFAKELSNYFSQAMYLCFKNNDVLVDVKLIGLKFTPYYSTKLKNYRKDIKNTTEKMDGLHLLNCLAVYVGKGKEALLESTIVLLVDKLKDGGFYILKIQVAIEFAFGKAADYGNLNSLKKLVEFVERIAPSTREANELLQIIFPNAYRYNVSAYENIFQYLVTLAKRISKDDETAYKLLLDVMSPDFYMGLREAYKYNRRDVLKNQLTVLKEISKIQPEPIKFLRNVLMNNLLGKENTEDYSTFLIVMIALGETGIFDRDCSEREHAYLAKLYNGFMRDPKHSKSPVVSECCKVLLSCLSTQRITPIDLNRFFPNFVPNSSQNDCYANPISTSFYVYSTIIRISNPIMLENLTEQEVIMKIENILDAPLESEFLSLPSVKTMQALRAYLETQKEAKIEEVGPTKQSEITTILSV